jgi:hypothetical protein
MSEANTIHSLGSTHHECHKPVDQHHAQKGDYNKLEESNSFYAIQDSNAPNAKGLIWNQVTAQELLWLPLWFLCGIGARD